MLYLGGRFFDSRGIYHSLIDQLQSIHYIQDGRWQTADPTPQSLMALVSSSQAVALTSGLQSSSLRPKNLISKKPSKVSSLTSRPPEIGSRANVCDLGSSQVEAYIKALLETVGTVDHVMFTAGRQARCHPH
jgi:hypothetical protein